MPGTNQRLPNEPLFTEMHDAGMFVPEPGAVYLSANFGTHSGPEERSRHVQTLAARSPDSDFVGIFETSALAVKLVGVGDDTEYHLRSASEMDQIWSRFVSRVVYLDVTGLTHPAWAPVLRAALRVGIDVRVAYVEPEKYRFNAIRTEGELFDLSERFEGIRSLPGFMSLAEPDDADVVLVPLLGFEGQRFSLVLNDVEVARENIVPIIGVPGFQPEFVYYAYHGNRLPLEETESWRDVRFATANCPFSAFYALQDLAHERADAFLKVAPIGTKPHGVGAVLFALSLPDRVELVYDHPIRRVDRTVGAAKLLVYHVSALRDRLVAA